ncbi:unnamed protein product [Cylicocyclus nassatus]|uniref:Uncharacterized protein n=1 Tax=Cylicocyclus nassatus TaxID=53992 RepID=A0AA36MCQ8_CYLNA|nr:unnamed protein product [Cylicocyclus nassatus]
MVQLTVICPPNGRLYFLLILHLPFIMLLHILKNMERTMLVLSDSLCNMKEKATHVMEQVDRRQCKCGMPVSKQ